MAQNDADKYKESQNGMMLNFVMEAVNYIAVIVSVVLTFSVAMLMDMLTSTCNFLRISICFFLNKKMQKNLKFSYNYGADRLEGLTALFCDVLMVLGSLIVSGVAAYRLFVPKEVSGFILVAVIFKVVCVLADVGILIPEYLAYKKTKTKIAKNVYEGMLASFALDFGILLGVFFSMILKSWSGVSYIEPVISIVIGVYIIVRAVQRIKVGINELTDLTLDEESQMKILKVVNSHFDEYDNFVGINSHRFGEKIFIDLDFEFSQSTTYENMTTFLDEISNELKADFPESEIKLSISNR